MMAGCEVTDPGDSSPAPKGQSTLSDPDAVRTGDNEPEYDLKTLTRIRQDSRAVMSLSRVANEKATDPRVKDYVSRVMAEHRTLNERMDNLAKRRGVDVPDLSDGEEKKVQQLRKQPAGLAFDKQYIAAVIREYGVMTSTMKDAARNVGDTDIRQFAVRNQSIVKDLEASARQLQKELNTKK
jgi:putative membrane protein